MAARKKSPRAKAAPARSSKTTSPAEILAALAPASGHLLAAAVELLAAARSALDALTADSAGLPAQSVEALRSARASLDLLSSLAATGAEAARAKAKDAARREAIAEIVGALDARAAGLSGPAAEAFAAVRSAVAGSGARNGAARPAPKPRDVPSPSRVARGSLRRIPIVLDPSASEE